MSYRFQVHKDITYVCIKKYIKIINIHPRIKFTILSTEVVPYLIMNIIIIINDNFYKYDSLIS